MGRVPAPIALATESARPKYRPPARPQPGFARHGTAVPPSKEKKNYRPGDVVTWDLSRGLTHIGIVSDKQSGDGVPLVIHNIGSGALEEDILFAYPITGHYRWQPSRADRDKAPGANTQLNK